MQFARVSRYAIDPDRMDEACEAFREAGSNLRELEGNEGGYFIVDRENGVALTITFWDSAATLDGSDTRAATLRRSASSSVEAGIEAVEKYEVAVEFS